MVHSDRPKHAYLSPERNTPNERSCVNRLEPVPPVPALAGRTGTGETGNGPVTCLNALTLALPTHKLLTLSAEDGSREIVLKEHEVSPGGGAETLSY